MIAFDSNGKIHKYESPEEILEEFYPLRLQYYQKRKVCFASAVITYIDDNQDHVSNELSNELDKLNNQARFVKMIVDKELVVSNRKKADIVAELRRKDFKPFPKVAQAKEAGETADVVEEEPEAPTVNSESNSDFDYLLGMAIWNLTKEKVRMLVHSRAILETESAPFQRLRNSTSKQKPNRINWRPISGSLPKISGIQTLPDSLKSGRHYCVTMNTWRLPTNQGKRGPLSEPASLSANLLGKRTTMMMMTTLRPTTNQRRVQVPNERMEKRQELESPRVKPRLLLLPLSLRQAAMMKMNLQLAIESA